MNADRSEGLFWGAGFSLISAIVTCLLAPHRGRSGFWWFLIGGFLPWLSIIILYLLDDLSAPISVPGGQPTPAAGVSAQGPPGGPGAPDAARWPSRSEAALALPPDGWFYALRRQPMGPVSLQYLRGAIEMGSLAKDVPVWCPSFRDWATPARVPGFFG
jgi:hypothetical protein